MKVPQKCVILFGFSRIAQILSLTSALKERGIKVICACADDMGKTLGALSGVTSQRPEKTRSAHAPAPGTRAASAVPGDPMILLCGLDTELEELLPLFSAAGMGSALKAVLTEENRSWTPGRLYDALRRERFQLG